MNTLTLNLSSKEASVLDELAGEQDLNKTALMRQALRLYQHVHEKGKRGQSMAFIDGNGALVRQCILGLDPLDALPTQPGPDGAGAPVERNFCERCGKRLHPGSIHTCTPPADAPPSAGYVDSRAGCVDSRAENRRIRRICRNGKGVGPCRQGCSGA